jgi:anti-sigma B factor antagonist
MDKFDMLLYDTVNAQKIRLVLDLSKCQYLTSVMLAVLVNYKKRCSAQGGDIKLACLNSLVRGIVEKTNLDRIFGIYDSVEAAVQAFNQNPGRAAS